MSVPRAAAGDRAAGPWRGWVEGSWPALSAGLLATSLVLALRPRSWRRPVSDAFWRHLGFATLGSLVAVAVAAGVVGIGVVAQALFWLEEFGEDEVVRSTLMRVLIRELAPITVGLVMLGRSGLMQLEALARLREDGTLRVLEAGGLDPCLFLAMPFVLALAVATFCNAVVFILLAMVIGYVTAVLIGLNVAPWAEFVFALTRDLGATGIFVLPLKSILIGLLIGAVVSATVLQPAQLERRMVLPRGFFRCLIVLFIVSGTLTLML
ncbi:MAG: hypothetical protein EA356_08895 [Geminicoccaceae bacterium]|nr:MAG: hypothetical protein EA356_08895 [Geminicoccaceae bacterium]